MRRILTEPKNCIVKQYNKLFLSQSINDKVSEFDIDTIVEKAKKLNCGARGLKTIAEEHFRDRFYR